MIDGFNLFHGHFSKSRYVPDCLDFRWRLPQRWSIAHAPSLIYSMTNCQRWKQETKPEWKVNDCRLEGLQEFQKVNAIPAEQWKQDRWQLEKTSCMGRGGERIMNDAKIVVRLRKTNARQLVEEISDGLHRREDWHHLSERGYRRRFRVVSVVGSRRCTGMETWCTKKQSHYNSHLKNHFDSSFCRFQTSTISTVLSFWRHTRVNANGRRVCVSSHLIELTIASDLWRYYLQKRLPVTWFMSAAHSSSTRLAFYSRDIISSHRVNQQTAFDFAVLWRVRTVHDQSNITT